LNIRDGDNVVLDHEGCELPDIAAALEEARLCARELAVDRIRSGRSLSNELIEVVREGDIVASVSVRDTIL
jgi:hypothetical protein